MSAQVTQRRSPPRAAQTMYQPVKPTACPAISRKFDEAKYKIHRKFVREAKPTIDTRQPESASLKHMKVKLKKIQLEEERKAQIDHDNRLLLQKMSKIMTTTGGVDNRNSYVPKSASRTKRQQELQRITQENQAILKRIQARKPNLDTKALEHDFVESRKHLAAISKFPPGHTSPKATLREPVGAVEVDAPAVPPLATAESEEAK